MSDSQDRWSHEVTAEDRHYVGACVFASGSAQDIADAVITAARDDGPQETVERRAIAKLTFYENRAGHNLTDERRAVLDEAKDLVRDQLAS
jgi:hypothetical protein